MDRHNENFILSAETLDHQQVKEFLGITSENPLILSSEQQILLIPITKKIYFYTVMETIFLRH